MLEKGASRCKVRGWQNLCPVTVQWLYSEVTSTYMHNFSSCAYHTFIPTWKIKSWSSGFQVFEKNYIIFICGRKKWFDENYPNYLKFYRWQDWEINEVY